MRVLIVVVVLLASLLPSPAAAAPGCDFKLGFKVIADQIPTTVGQCLEDEHPDGANAVQKTAGGLLVWRKADNFTAFTDGYRSWVNGPYGLQQRLNTETFAWEAPAPAPPPRAAPAPPPPPPRPTIPCAIVPRLMPKATIEALRKQADSMLPAFAAVQRAIVDSMVPSDGITQEMVDNCTGSRPAPAPAPGVVYRPNANLTRVGDDLYRDTLTGGYVRTFLCLELAVYEDAIVLSDKVIFTRSGNTCQVALF